MVTYYFYLRYKDLRHTEVYLYDFIYIFLRADVGIKANVSRCDHGNRDAIPLPMCSHNGHVESRRAIRQSGTCTRARSARQRRRVTTFKRFLDIYRSCSRAIRGCISRTSRPRKKTPPNSVIRETFYPRSRARLCARHNAGEKNVRRVNEEIAGAGLIYRSADRLGADGRRGESV